MRWRAGGTQSYLGVRIWKDTYYFVLLWRLTIATITAAPSTSRRTASHGTAGGMTSATSLIVSELFIVPPVPSGRAGRHPGIQVIGTDNTGGFKGSPRFSGTTWILRLRAG